MKEGIKILLVYPNPAMDNIIPIGVSTLAAQLKQAGHKVKLFDTTFYASGRTIGEHFRERNLQVIITSDIRKEKGIKRINRNVYDDFEKVVNEYQPDVIGVSVFEISYLQGINLLRKVKDYPCIKIMGGIHVTFSPEEVINEDSVDVICVGEGEDAFEEFANCVRDKKDYSHIKNLWVKNNGNIIKNDVRPLKDMNEVPFQDWSIFDKNRYYKPFLGNVTVSAVIQTTRGCPGICSYCCNPNIQKLYKHKGKYLRVRDIKIAMDEIKYLKENYNIGFIKFADADIFAKPRKDFDKFIDLYRDIQIPFWAQSRPDTVKEDKIKALESVGCKGFAIGIESGNEYIRNDVLKKHISNEQIEEAVRVLRTTNIRINSNIMIGIPYETREMIFDSINFIRKLDIKIPIINIFNPYRGTPLYDLCVKEKYLLKGEYAGDYRGDYVLEMPQITKEEIYGLQRTFPLYVNFDKSMWSEIEKAEKDDKVFEKLGERYIKEFLKIEVK